MAIMTCGHSRRALKVVLYLRLNGYIYCTYTIHHFDYNQRVAKKKPPRTMEIDGNCVY